MLKRLGMGLIKGLVVGLALGAGLHFGLGWTTLGLVAGFLVAMGAAATAGLFTGKPPWRQGAAVESVLKAAFGLGVGALAYWLASSYGAAHVPFSLFGTPEDAAWTSLPLLFVPAVAALYGTFVELDNTGTESKKAPSRSTPKLRVGSEPEADEVEARSKAAPARRRV